MADETIVQKTEDTVAKAAEAVAAPVVEVAEKVAPKTVRKVRAKVAKVRAKRASAKVVKAVADVNAKAVKAAKRTATKTIRAAQDAPTQTLEGNTIMTEFNKLFAGLELPTADRFQTLFADAGEKGREALAKTRDAAEEFTGVAKANVEAMVEAGKIAVAGAKTIGEELVETGKGGLETATADFKTLAAATSPAEYFQLQGDIVRASFDRMVATGSQLTERMVKLAGEAAEPLQARASLNAERIKALMA